MQDTEAIFSEVRRLVTLLDIEERLALIRDIATAPLSSSPTKKQNIDAQRLESAEERRAHMRAEQEKWYARSAVERNQYHGFYVALDGGNVVDHDIDQRALYLRIRQVYGSKPVPIIPAEQSAIPEFVIRSPRLDR